MSDILLRLPDGSEKRYSRGISGQEVAEKIGSRLAKDALAIKIDGRLQDLNIPLENDAAVEIVTFSAKEGREVYWHSTSHLLAHAVKQLYPQARLAIGPAIDEGFYYDFDFERPFTPEDLAKIEARMNELAKANSPVKRRVLAKADALSFFQKKGEPYKTELISELADDTISLYEQGDFADLCRGPHVASTAKIKAFKLLSVAGAYWRGDEKNKMLQRIYGVSYPAKDALDAYLARLEEIKRRDHRKLGRELDLFSLNDEVGPGLPSPLVLLAVIRNIIENFWREEHYRGGYQLVFSPHIARLDLWKQSGHWDFYRENMYSPIDIDTVQYELKPMNCGFHIMIYNSALRSYKDLPIRHAELGTVYRYERSGVLHGLMRVRGFTQDDAHIFCRPDQLEEEILRVLDFTLFILKTFGFSEYDIYLSTRPEKFVGSPENWERSTNALKAALETRKLAYEVDPGEGVFYGPKIDIKIKDVLGRSWQCSTIQVDFNNPERFNITYVGEDNKPHQPIMVHRALMGSLERFFGVLIEHYAGAFPVWLAPVQVKVATITDRLLEYAGGVRDSLLAAGIRVELDGRPEKVGFKVREAALQKVPYILVVGDKEAEQKTVAVRERGGRDLGAMQLQEFIALLSEKIRDKSISTELSRG